MPLPIYDDRRQLLGVAAVDFSLTGISQFLRFEIWTIGRNLERRTGLLVAVLRLNNLMWFKIRLRLSINKIPSASRRSKRDVLTRRTAEYLQQRWKPVCQTQQLDF